MITEALFIKAPNWKQFKCLLTDEQIKKMQYSCAMEFYSAINEPTTDTCNSMDESQIYYAKRKEPKSKATSYIIPFT